MIRSIVHLSPDAYLCKIRVFDRYACIFDTGTFGRRWSFDMRLETGASADAGDAVQTKRGRERHYGCKVHISIGQSSCVMREG